MVIIIYVKTPNAAVATAPKWNYKAWLDITRTSSMFDGAADGPLV
jgi:hypothetical protein